MGFFFFCGEQARRGAGILESLLVFCCSSDPTTRAGGDLRLRQVRSAWQWELGSILALHGAGGDQSTIQALLQPWMTSLLTVISAGGFEGIRVLWCRLPQWSLMRFGFFCSLAFCQLLSPKISFLSVLFFFFPPKVYLCIGEVHIP